MAIPSKQTYPFAAVPPPLITLRPLLNIDIKDTHYHNVTTSETGSELFAGDQPNLVSLPLSLPSA